MMMQSSPTMIKTVTFLSCVEALLLGDMEKIYVRETRQRKRESQEGGKKGCALLYCAPRSRLRKSISYLNVIKHEGCRNTTSFPIHILLRQRK